MKRKLAYMTCCAFAAGVIGVGVVAPAASASISECKAGSLCMWQNANESGIFWSRNSPTNLWSYVGDAFNDRASSLLNYREHNAWLSADYPKSNRQVCVGPGWDYNDLSVDYWPQNESSANDSISSYVLSGSQKDDCPVPDPVFYHLFAPVKEPTVTTETGSKTTSTASPSPSSGG